jgi:hypothetical protein
MSDLPDDPHRAGIGLYGQPIQDGKHILDALTEQEHYTGALRLIQALDDRQLTSLALTVAADAALTRAEQAGDGDVWIKWWRGVDSPGESNPDAADTSPGIMMRTLRTQGT